MIKGTGHFRDEDTAGNRGPDTRGKITGHCQDDKIGGINPPLNWG